MDPSVVARLIDAVLLEEWHNPQPYDKERYTQLLQKVPSNLFAWLPGPSELLNLVAGRPAAECVRIQQPEAEFGCGS